MFLANLKALIDVSSAPDGITAHELDARVEGVLKVCDQFTSVSALKDFIRSCLRAEAIKSVAARGDKISYAHGQANNFLITPCLPTSRGNDAATSGNTDKLRCTHQGCPSPQNHDTSACEYHAQLVLDRKREREKAACAAAFFSALSSNKSGNGSASSYYSCLSDTDSTKSACLSATPASTDTSAHPPSSSFWSCFAPATATCYATIKCDKKKEMERKGST